MKCIAQIHADDDTFELALNISFFDTSVSVEKCCREYSIHEVILVVVVQCCFIERSCSSVAVHQG